MLDKLINLRHELHRLPELSQQEKKTALRIKSFVAEYNPTEIITGIGGEGIVVIYNYNIDGPTIAIRCELDALPIVEENQFSYRSEVEGVSHKCGHDGHMAIVAGLCKWLENQEMESGRVVLIFQPSEENGKGAHQMLQDKRFTKLDIDYMFALHNIPGQKMHSIITMEQGFSAEVQSFSVKLTGHESHAAEPENGINPALGISELVARLDQLNLPDPCAANYTVLTPVYINMGEKSYGISPAEGEAHYTIRTWSTLYMDRLQGQIIEVIEEIGKTQKLDFKIDWFEHFPAAENNSVCNTIIRDAVKESDFDLIERPYPFKFGEDFGWFSKEYKAGMFGLGAGVDTPALHSRTYDFPDELIETGVAVFKEIIIKVLRDG